MSENKEDNKKKNKKKIVVIAIIISLILITIIFTVVANNSNNQAKKLSISGNRSYNMVSYNNNFIQKGEWIIFSNGSTALNAKVSNIKDRNI